MASRSLHCVLHHRRFWTVAATVWLVLPIGCRQTTGPTANGPLQPYTAPEGTLNVPSLIPFNGASPFGGSASRVTPPATGAASPGAFQPNNYMGGTPSASNLSPSNVEFASGAGSDWRGESNAIGSGVVQTGFSAPGTDASPNAPRTETSSVRSGGMKVIDLTGAPPPPGYHSTFGASVTGQPGIGQPGIGQPAPGSSGGQIGFSTGQGFVPTRSAYDSGDIGFGQSTAQSNGLRQVNAQVPASALGPPPRVRLATQGTSTNPAPASVSNGSAVRPSTQPLNNTSGDALPWRNPSEAF